MRAALRGRLAADFHNAIAADILGLGRCILALLLARRPGKRLVRVRLNPVLWPYVMEHFEHAGHADIWHPTDNLWRVEVERFRHAEAIFRPFEQGQQRLLTVANRVGEGAEAYLPPLLPGQQTHVETCSLFVSPACPLKIAYSEYSGYANITAWVQIRNVFGAVVGPT